MKTKTAFIILFLSFLSQIVAVAQIDSLNNLPIDSLLDWLDKQSDTNNEALPKVAHFALKLVLKEGDYKSAARIHDDISYWNYINYEVNGFDTIAHHRIKQIEYDEKINNLEFVGKGYLGLAIDFYNDNQLEKSQKALFKSIEIFKSLNDEAALAEAHANLAYIYILLKKYRQALNYLELSHPIFVKNRDYFMIADNIVYGLSETYLMLEDYPNALKHIDECIRLCNEYEFQQNEKTLFEAYKIKGRIFLAKKEFAKAETLFIKAWEFSKEHFSKEVATQSRLEIGNTLYLQAKYKEALPHLYASSQVSEKLPLRSSTNFRKLSECYEKLGQYKKALTFRTKAFDLEEKISKDKIASLESEGLVKYETEKKESMIALQNQEIAQQKRAQIIFIGFLGLLGILLAVLYKNFKNKQKLNQQLQVTNDALDAKNQQNELLLKEIHHRVKNNLEVVSSLLALQSRQLDDQNAKSAMQESQNRVQSMGIIHQNLYQGENLAAIEMKDYFVNLGEGILDSFGKSEQVNITCVMEELELDVDTAVPIGLIVNELLTNALKYAFVDEEHPEIQIKLERLSDDSLQLKVSDNGIGKAENEVAKGTGFGSQLVQLLTAQLEGAMDYVAHQGSHFSFHFKTT